MFEGIFIRMGSGKLPAQIRGSRHALYVRSPTRRQRNISICNTFMYRDAYV